MHPRPILHIMHFTCVSIPALDVTVLITTSGSTVVGMSYTLTCTVSGADNLEATISIEFTGPNSGSGTGTSLQLPLILDLTDAGQYTCTATVSSGLLSNDLIFTDTEDINIPSECSDCSKDFKCSEEQADCEHRCYQLYRDQI